MICLDWVDIVFNKVEFVCFIDGIINILLKVINKCLGFFKEEVDGEVILLCVYGNGIDVIIDWFCEMQNYELLMRYGLVLELFVCFENGMMYCFIQGLFIQFEDLCKFVIYKVVV